MRIGLPEEPKSLNLWLGTDANSRKILSLIYQPLFTRDPETLEIIPWLARGNPLFDKKKVTCTVKLRSAKWSDGSEFTSNDVLFTRKLFFDFKIPKYYGKWKSVIQLEAVDKHTLIFHLDKPSAIFMSRVLTSPVVSEKQWKTIAENALKAAKPLRYLQNHTPADLLGTGPFVLSRYKKGAYIHMKKNPHFFAAGKTIANHCLGPHVDSLLFKIYNTSDIAILALEKGAIDMYWWDIQPGYIKNLKKNASIKLFYNKKSALYYMGFNLRRPPFNDKDLRKAVATAIDKKFILTRILQNYGTPIDSIVPSGNLFWSNPNVKRYGEGLTQKEHITKAFKILKSAGYTWDIEPVDAKGNIVTARGLKLPSGKPMGSFIILTPPADYDPRRAFAGIMIQEWLKKLGMQVSARPMAFNSLLETVKSRHDFDAFILGYGRLSLDPDYLRTFFHSNNDKPNGWNMTGYNNPLFDRLASLQKSIVDIDQRKKIIWKMQEMLMEDLPFIPLYNPSIIEAVRCKNFSGWIEKVDGIGNIWSFCMVKPNRKKYQNL